jgi:hypothetical protein
MIAFSVHKTFIAAFSADQMPNSGPIFIKAFGLGHRGTIFDKRS